MTETEDDLLERIVVDKDAVNRERLADTIEGVLGVDRDTGEVVTQPGYYELDNEPKFMARLLARRTAFELGIIEEGELGDTGSEFAERMEASQNSIRNYGSLDFVANDDENGRYYIDGQSIGLAIDFIREANSDNA